MTIPSDLESISNTKAAIKQAIINKGVSVSSSDDFATYPSKIASISGGTLTTKTITTNGTYAASSDNADGYSSVTVSVSGGGGSSRLFNANYVVLPDGTVQNIVLGSQTISATATTISSRIYGKVPANSIYVDLSSIQQITSSYGLSSAFEDFSNLEYVDISNLEQCSLFDYAFAGTSISKLYFNSMSYSYCEVHWEDEVTLTGMLTDVTGCTVHFPSNFQSLIGSWSDVIDGFSGTNTTVLFDLPATT